MSDNEATDEPEQEVELGAEEERKPGQKFITPSPGSYEVGATHGVAAVQSRGL